MCKTAIFHIVIGLFLFFLLSGCSISQADAPPSNKPQSHPSETGEKNEDINMEQPKPLKVERGSFEKVYGWLDDQTILYSYVMEGNYYLTSYNIFGGNQESIFTSDAPIMNVLIHKNTEKLFIHTSQYSHSANIYFTDYKANIEFSTEIDSYELVYEWNEMNPSLMLLTAFFEDWSYNVKLINSETGSVENIEDVQPFLKWYDDKQILEQDWKENEVSFFAPVLKKSLISTTDSEKIFDKVFRFDTFNDHFMTIKVEEENKEEIKYSFYDSKLKEISHIAFPNLTQYSDWLIPYYTFNKNDTFLTFAPKKHDSADHYNEGFELVSIDIKQHKKNVLFNDLENKPIMCSNEGDLCLYGYQYEQLLNIKTGKQFPLVITST
ncbi:YqgU-like beta propeller domain-containing protein [Lederbergia citri]|uniref:YqgU-like 6-bladed beta-propeller domain-containing protein n=1 Tax=Lederbergia citri TaxID=2833580 RepID=A0A942TBI5_9BACI|nr:hypothetical protein [Lederbergia citri]MBS4194680.1 hypothetical protein [Lederbergia citri]